MVTPEKDASRGETSLARALLQEATEMAVAGNLDGSLGISRKIVDRYWSQQGRNYGAIALDAFETYLFAARFLVKTQDQLDAFVWLSDLLIEKLLKTHEIERVISLLQRRARFARTMRNGIHGHRDATRVIEIIVRHRVKLEKILDSAGMHDRIREALWERFWAPSVNSILLGSVEDLVGFEISHPGCIELINLIDICIDLADRDLFGPALSLRLITREHFGKEDQDQLTSIVMEWMPEDYFDQIEKYWVVGEGHVFDWRIPRISTAVYMEYLTEFVANSCDEEREFGERLLISAARNSQKIDNVWMAAMPPRLSDHRT
jgi:hypothetical protein